MTEPDREFVRRRYPAARAEWVAAQDTSGHLALQRGYWMIRSGTGQLLGLDPLRETAWTDAALRIRATASTSSSSG